MTLEIALLMGIVAVALVLFSIERMPADVVALGVLVILVLTGVLPAEKAFAGFGSDAVMLILGLLILTASLVRTGVVEIAGRRISQHTGTDERRVMGIIMGASALLSTFMSNTASTAFFVPIVVGVSRKAKMSSGKLLMPLAFATILASSVTLIATSTNIVVSGLMTGYGMRPLGMFELTPVGLPIAIAGIAYMLTIGRHLIPDRSRLGDEFRDFGEDTYLTETIIQPNSPLAGKTLSESALGRDLDLTVVRVVRSKTRYLAPRADLQLQGGDILLVEGSRDEILKIKNVAGIELLEDTKVTESDLENEDVSLVEAILLPRSQLLGRTLRGLRFRERFGLQVLALNRHGETIRRKIAHIPLRLGDVLLIQGSRDYINTLQDEGTIRVLDSHEQKIPNQRRAPIAISAFAGALILGSTQLVALPVALFLGVLIVFVSRCITPEEAYREVEWRALILIGSMLALGTALEETGAAKFLAMEIVRWFGQANPIWLLTAFFMLSMLLTQPMSNQAAAVVVVPIAIQTALQLGLNPRTFAVMIAVGASTSYLTPLEPACLIVYGAGRYKFVDFLKVGFLLSFLVYLIAILLVPIIWPLS